LLENPKYLRRKGALEGIENFDADFFNFTPKEAKITDPQQRLFLESTWEAFEHAGYDPYNYPGTVGVMGGLGSSNTYYQKNLQFSDYGQDVVGEYQLSLNNSADFLCTRVAYKLNLQGSAATIQSACSTSLVPSVMGFQALINYQADLIVAGGSAITLPAKSGYMYEDGMILSPDGHCRTFDSAAQGTVPGNATGVILLKRLEDAVRDGDTIYATIRGAAFNNDGNRKVGFTASGLDGQTRVISEAMQTANVSPESISYVEAHGTGTPLGDPIEIRALTKAWYANVDEKKKGYCAIGSVKSNTGHCDAAAGVTGLIKTVCALHHKQIPPSLHYSNANPQIDFANSPFYVNTELTEWKKNGTPRRAGVSSFGMGGTNAHVILEEAPVKEASSAGRDWLMFTYSAKTPTALETMKEHLIAHLKSHPEQNPADIAYTGQVGRHAFKYREVIVCENTDSAINALSTENHRKVLKGEILSEKTPDMIFLFPGQGAQYLNMGRDLYQNESVFREHLDHCAELLQPLLEEDIRELLYPASNQTEEQVVEKNEGTNSERLNQTAIAQPVLFSIEYAMSQLLIHWGVKPAMLAGHSLGEYTAACVAGVMSLDDCLKMISIRARLMQTMEPGSMLAVPLSEMHIKPYLQSGLDLAVVNGTERCVISGPDELIQLLKTQLQSEEIEARVLHTSHAYHSSMMEPMLAEFYETLEDIDFQVPVIPLISSTNGKPIQIMDRAYWTSQIRETVRFSDVLSQVYQTSDCIILEVGPGNTLSSFARGHSNKPSNTLIFNTMRHTKENLNDNELLCSTISKLWIAGVAPDWSSFYQNEQRYRVPIPTYPFQRKRFWVDAPSEAYKANQLGGLYKKKDINDWFYTPSWKRTQLSTLKYQVIEETLTYLVFVDEKGVSEQFINVLLQNEQHIIKVKKGERFSQQDDCFVINHEDEKDYVFLIDALLEAKHTIDAIAHFWMLSDKDHKLPDEEQFQQYQHDGLYSLLFLSKALEKIQVTQEIDLLVITNQLFNVSGQEEIEPAKATISGAIKVIPQEYPHIQCTHCDIVLSDWENDETNQLGQYLLGELEHSDRIIAYRKEYRWLETHETLQFKETDQVSILKKQGVYFITGGLGGVGIALASYLSESVQARLILLSRTQLPEKELWTSWLQKNDKQERIYQTIRKLQKIESLGGEVLVISADVTSIQEMKKAVEQSIKQFGCVNGVIHAAGVPGIEMIQDASIQSIMCNMAAKVQGTKILNKVFELGTLDFMLLCSSLSTTLGGLGFSSYCAANAYLDAFAQQKKIVQNTPVYSVDWEGWSEVGMAVDSDMISEKGNDLGLLTTEGIDVFKRVLSQNLPHIIISTADLNLRLEQSMQKKQKIIDVVQTRTLDTEYSKPTNPIEGIVADIWQKALGIEHIGIDDDFFELGGDSLTAVQLIPKLRKAFSMELSPHSLIQNPTIRAFSENIEQEQLNNSDKKTISPLLVELKSGESDEPPLFLIHPVGGSVYIYRDLANGLNTEYTVYGIQAKGWDGKEEPLKTIDEMALLYTDIIRQVQPEGPYRIGGASLGGVIAFEMAQQLQSSGQMIDLLMMMDTPGTGHMPKDVFKTDLDVLLYLLNISVESTGLAEKLKSLDGEKQLQFFIDEQNKTDRQLFPDINELRHFLSLFMVNAEALRTYQSESYSGDVLFFVAHEKDEYNAKEPQKAWAQVVQSIEVIEVAGNHISMNQQPNVKTIVKRLHDFFVKKNK
ncbi:MAG: SDR family NAD(P)-dependent oxidoreductase, partial [Gammaproteobacteria bacterium]|nr:SDR family NAD(P)-dependent oxidoreductase [Gammaproteobacteria bacterium]